MDTNPKSSRNNPGGPAKRIGVDLMDEKPPKHHMLPVWFFIGLILLMYGVIICGTGIYELFHPPSTVLASLHAPIWWGAVMAVVGAGFVNAYRPGKS